MRRATAGAVRAALRQCAAVGAAAAVMAGCATSDPAAGLPRRADSPSTTGVATATALPSPSATPEPAGSPSTTPAPTETAPAGQAVQRRPDWLGTRVLPTRPDGLGEIQPTPPELVDRRLPPPEPRPAPDDFQATIEPVPADVVVRSTWSADCPVSLAELRYLTLTFWGFDELPHLGEMIVHSSVANDVVDVFAQLYDAHYPIEEMRVVAAPELDAPPTGDGNNTSAFVCRSSTGGTNWSQHAYGLAVDINPFHNPYHRGDAVIPELASAYLDRSRDVPGVITAGDVVTAAFASIGWGWGGNWNASKDWMHFSRSGR